MGGLGESLILGVQDGDNIGERCLGAVLAKRILRKHNLDAETNDALAEVDVADGGIDEALRRGREATINGGAS